MFPKFDYLFNIALVLALAFMGFYLGFQLSQLLGV
jgi:hypothetical protein